MEINENSGVSRGNLSEYGKSVSMLDDSDETNGTPPLTYGYGARHAQIVLMFLCEVIIFGIRMNLPISIVAMTTPKDNVNPSIPTFPQWTDDSLVLSSYFWGFVITELFGGYLAQRYGFKWFLVISMTISSIFSFFLPALTEEYGYYGTMFARMMQGLGQGILYPMVANFLSKWVPDDERSFFTTFILSGGDLGTVIVTAVAGYYASTWLGWPFTFKLYGVIGLVWALAFAIYGSNSPEFHCSISEKEVLYITKGRKKQTNQNKTTPWKAIFTSPPVWSLWLCTISSYWGGEWVLSMEVPTFMSEQLGLSIRSDSAFMTSMYLSSWILSFPAGGCTQYIINRNIASVGNTRKIMNSLAFYISAICMVGIAAEKSSNSVLCLVLLVIAIIVDSFGYCSFYPNYVDISPHYCGTLFGIGQWAATVFTIICPLAIKTFVNGDSSYRSEILFYYTAGLYVVTNTIYLIFGSGETQEWDSYDDIYIEDVETTLLLSQKTRNQGY